MTLKELIASKGITATCEYGAPANPDMANMDGWTVTLRNGKRRMTVPFYMGSGHHGSEPEVDDVLDCLLSDASSFENAGDFEEFASELGYDSDSRKAERIYKSCGRTAKRLRQFLGDDFDALNEAER